MKNLWFLAALLLLAACTDSRKNNQAALAPAMTIKDITLNGLSRTEADKLVKGFIADRVSIDSRTAVRFNKKFIENIITVLRYEKGDGVRIYFAKNDKKQNTLVFVSTRDAGPSDQPKHRIHQDYFAHGSPVLDDKDMKNVDEHDAEVKEGLYSAKPCPDQSSCISDHHFISCEKAKMEAVNFKKGQEIKTTAVWFDLGLFEKLYASLTLAEQMGKKDVGIRFYVVKGIETGTHTLVIATTENVNGVHTDFYECYKTSNFKSADLDNHAEECPIFCNGTTW